MATQSNRLPKSGAKYLRTRAELEAAGLGDLASTLTLSNPSGRESAQLRKHKKTPSQPGGPTPKKG